MKQTTESSLTTEQQELAKTSSKVQLEIAEEIGVSIQTVYQWALYHPERIASKAAAMRVINKHLKATA